MIPLSRERTANVVPDEFHDIRRRALNLELMVDRRFELNDPNIKQKFTSSRWKKAKLRLLEETHNKCAYCEAPTSVVAYGDVEHYRPKSSYWWLAYCYENYLASCQLCNQAYKKAKFSVKGTKIKCPVSVRRNSTDSYLNSKADELSPSSLLSQAVEDFESLHTTERPYILNPYVDDPSDWFAWEADEILKTVRLIPRSGVPDATRIVRAAEEDLGLNRKELRELRFLEFDKFRIFKLVLNEGVNSPAILAQVRVQIDSMLSPSSAFSGMLNYFDSRI